MTVGILCAMDHCFTPCRSSCRVWSMSVFGRSDHTANLLRSGCEKVKIKKCSRFSTDYPLEFQDMKNQSASDTPLNFAMEVSFIVRQIPIVKIIESAQLNF